MTVCHACGQSVDARSEKGSTNCQRCGHVRAVHVCKYVHHVGGGVGRVCNCEDFHPRKES